MVVDVTTGLWVGFPGEFRRPGITYQYNNLPAGLLIEVGGDAFCSFCTWQQVLLCIASCPGRLCMSWQVLDLVDPGGTSLCTGTLVG